MAPYVVGALIGLGSIVKGLAVGTHNVGRSLFYIGVGAALVALDAWVIRAKSTRSDE
jgi:hypothetical protein